MINHPSIVVSFSMFSALLVLSPDASAQFWKRKKVQHQPTTQPLPAVPVYESDIPVARALPVIESQLAVIPRLDTVIADTHFEKKSMLVQQRRQDLTGVDACAENPNQKTFLHAIEGAVRMGMVERKIETHPVHIDPAYGLPGPENSMPVSLMSHPLCIQDADQLAAILDKEYTPDNGTIEALKQFSMASNEDRRRALNGDVQALKSFTHRMTQMMSCLSYAESMQTADSEKSDANFHMALNEIAGSKPLFARGGGEAARPQGVLFSEDRPGEFFVELRKAAANGTRTPELEAQLKAKYKPWPVVGTYQFNPRFGNVGPCVAQWNALVNDDRCKINNASPAQVMAALASPGQTFNTFCGVQKIVQAFNSQVNTSNATGVDKSNILPNGRLKAPKDRCVSLVARSGAGRIYSHFGPWRNSVKDNMGKLMGCVSKATR